MSECVCHCVVSVCLQETASGQSPQWSFQGDNYSSSTPNTPGQQQTTASAESSQLDPSSQSMEQQLGLISQQQGGGAAAQSISSPQPHFDNDLKKQPSISSLRDALLSTPISSASQQITPQQYTSYSPRVPGGHPSPMTPTANFPHTPDASTPAGSSIMSPRLQQHYEEKPDSQLPSESALINSLAQPSAEEEGRPARVSPYQVESILGIRNDKPLVEDSRLMDVSSPSGEGNSMMSPKGGLLDGVQRPAKANSLHSSEASSQQKADSQLPVPPPNFDPFASPLNDSSALKVLTTHSTCLPSA